MKYSYEAVEIRRQLAAQQPLFLQDLATSLNNHGMDLINAHRLDEGLEALQNAVAIWRRLAEGRPDMFLPQMATSLDNLGRVLCSLGEIDSVLAVVQEGLVIRRLRPAC